MMAEDKKPQEELEFISVEPEARASGAPAAKEASAKSVASPKASDKEALYVAPGERETLRCLVLTR